MFVKENPDRKKMFAARNTLVTQEHINEWLEYFRNYLGNIPIKNTLHGLTHQWILPRATCFSILPGEGESCSDVQVSSAPTSCVSIRLYETVVNIEIKLL